MRTCAFLLLLFFPFPAFSSAPLPPETTQIASSLSTRRTLLFLHLRKIDALLRFAAEQIERDPSIQSTLAADPQSKQTIDQVLALIKTLPASLGLDLQKGLILTVQPSPFLLQGRFPLALSAWFWLKTPDALSALLAQLPAPYRASLHRDSPSLDQEAIVVPSPLPLLIFRQGLRVSIQLLPDLTSSLSKRRSWLSRILFAPSFEHFARLLEPPPPARSLASAREIAHHTSEIADPSGFLYLNLQSIARLSLALLPPRSLPSPLRPLLRRLLLSTLGGYSVAFDLFPQALRTNLSGLLSFGPSGHPFASLFSPATEHLDPSTFLPSSTLFASQTTFRFDRLLPLLRSLASTIPPLSRLTSRETLLKRRIQQEFGLDIEQEFLAHLSGQILTTFFLQPSNRSPLIESLEGCAIFLGLRHSTSFRSSLKKILDLLVLRKTLPSYQVQTISSTPIWSLHLPKMPLPLHLAFHKTWLVIAPDISTLQTILTLPSSSSLASKFFPASPERLAFLQGQHTLWLDLSSLSKGTTDLWKPTSIEEETAKRSLLRIQRLFYRGRHLRTAVLSFFDGQNRPLLPSLPSLLALPPASKTHPPHIASFLAASLSYLPFTGPFAALSALPLLTDPLILGLTIPVVAIPAFLRFQRASRLPGVRPPRP